MDYMTEDEIKAPKPLAILGKIIKWAFIVFMVLILLWFGICGVLQRGTSRVKGYIYTEKSASQADLTVYDLLAYNEAAMKDMELTEKLFFTDNVTLTEEPSQIQVMLRYNLFKEQIKEMTSDGKGFTFVLKDDCGNSYNTCFAVTDSKLIYGYYRVIFEDIDLSKAEKLSLYIYADNDSNLPELADICTVWYKDGPMEKHKLTNAEKKTADKTTELVTITSPAKSDLKEDK